MSSVLAGAAAVLAMTLSACGGSQYHYVKSSDSTVFFKVPNKWKSYDTRDLVIAEAQVNEQLGRPQSVDDIRLNAAIQWRVGFDASPKPSPVNVVLFYNDELVVDARTRLLLPDERASVGVDQLRNLVLPIDELQKEQDDALQGQPPALSINRDFEVRVNQEIKRAGGFHGLQTIVDLRAPDPDNRVYVFNTIALLDAANTKLTVLNIHCETLCYERNRSTIEKIVKSFTMLEKKA
jgi:hypothetical protein